MVLGDSEKNSNYSSSGENEKRVEVNSDSMYEQDNSDRKIPMKSTPRKLYDYSFKNYSPYTFEVFSQIMGDLLV